MPLVVIDTPFVYGALGRPVRVLADPQLAARSSQLRGALGAALCVAPGS